MTVVIIKDTRDRRLAASVDKLTGEVMLTRPCGKAGVIERIMQVPRSEIRRFARDLLGLVGEHDQ